MGCQWANKTLSDVLRLPDYRIYQSHFVGQLFWTRTNMGVDRNLNSPLLIGPGKRRSNFQKPWVHPWWSQQKRPPTMSNVNLELLIAQWVVKKRVEYHSNTKVSLCGCFGYHQFSWFIIMSAEKKSLAIYIYTHVHFYVIYILTSIGGFISIYHHFQKHPNIISSWLVVISRYIAFT